MLVSTYTFKQIKKVVNADKPKNILSMKREMATIYLTVSLRVELSAITKAVWPPSSTSLR